MRRPAVVVGMAAATMLIPTTAHAATGTSTDPVGDVRRVHDGRVSQGVTGDSDITGVVLRARSNEGEALGVRLRVQVREIDRSSRWNERERTGLEFSARFTTEDGASVTFSGHPYSYSWSYDDASDCFSDDLPDLTYGRYSDTITLDLPGECFTGAESVSVVVGTKLIRKRDRLVDRASTGQVAFGKSGSGSS